MGTVMLKQRVNMQRDWPDASSTIKMLEDCWPDCIKHYGDCFNELKLPYVKSRYDFYLDEQRKLPDLI